MEDIEDMGKSLVNGVDGRSISYHDRGVSLKVKRSKKKIEQTQEVQESIETKEEDCTKHVPGTQSIFIKTYGCSHNVSDSEYMAGQLASYGYDIVEDPNLAHLWVVNSCTVKNPSEASFMTCVFAFYYYYYYCFFVCFYCYFLWWINSIEKGKMEILLLIFLRFLLIFSSTF